MSSKVRAMLLFHSQMGVSYTRVSATVMCCWCFSTSEKGISRCCAHKDETPKAPSPPANLQLTMSSGKSQEDARCCQVCDPEQSS